MRSIPSDIRQNNVKIKSVGYSGGCLRTLRAENLNHQRGLIEPSRNHRVAQNTNQKQKKAKALYKQPSLLYLEFCCSLANALYIFAEKFPQIIQAKRHQSHSINSNSPSQNRLINSHRFCNFRAENS